ncbi:MAG: hypothetical protein JXB62_18155 [Pirellulales bacterium]|nr:hypothetical protein [Pirellulales bacterium]
MSRALRMLLRLRLRGFRRRVFRNVKTLRGGIFFLMGTAMIVLWLGPSLAMATAMDLRSDPQTVRAVVPLALLAMCLLNVVTSANEKSMHFTPAEVDFLFSGPFTRRELLAYKLSGSAAAAVLVALMLSAVFLRHSTFWIAALVGYLTMIVFIQLFSMALLLLSQTAAEHAYTRVRRLVLLVALTLAAVAGWHVFSAGSEKGFLEFARQLHQSPGFWVLAPLEVFGRTLAAEHLVPDLLVWGTLAVAVDAALLVLVMKLDVNYIETAMAVSAKLYERTQRARRGGVAWAAAAGRPRWHLPPFPRLGGAGLIARRQLIGAGRTAKGLVFLLIIMAIAAGPMLMTLGRQGETTPGASLLAPVIGNLVFLTVILARMLPFDFRGDVDHLDWLKSLPLGCRATAAGQLVAPALMMTLIHVLILGGVACLVPNLRAYALLVMAFAPVFNWLLFGLENLLFLLFPSRMAAAGPGDLQFVGRMMLEMLAKILILAACGGLAAGLGMLAYVIFGDSATAAGLTAWLTLGAIAVSMVPCVAWAYRRFDVSTDTPP